MNDKYHSREPVSRKNHFFFPPPSMKKIIELFENVPATARKKTVEKVGGGGNCRARVSR